MKRTPENNYNCMHTEPETGDYSMVLKKGVYYFNTWQEAKTFSNDYGFPATIRLISYDLGWAIQIHKSGPYYGPKGWA